MKPDKYIAFDLNKPMVLGIIILINIFGSSKAFDENSDMCNSARCNITASFALKRMNKLVDACENFYEYACGNANGSIAHKELKSVLLTQNSEVMHWDSLGDLSSFYIKAHTYFKSCMDEDTINEESDEDLKKIFNEMGGWPLLQNDLTSVKRRRWTDVIYEFRKRGFPTSYILTVEIEFNYKHPGYYMIHIDQPSLGLAREYLMQGKKNPMVKAYKCLIEEVAIMLGAKGETEKAAEEILEFEMQLADIVLPSENRTFYPNMYHEMDCLKLSETYPNINWQYYLSQMFPCTEIPVDEIVNNRLPDFVEKLSKLLSKYETSQHVVINYLFWRATYDYLPHLSARIRQADDNFNEVMNGKSSSNTSRAGVCAGDLDRRFQFVMGALYLASSSYDESFTKPFTDMFENVRKSMSKMINKVNWLRGESRLSADGKVIDAETYIAYPEELKNETILENYYKNLTIVRGKYLKNALNVDLHKTDEECPTLREENDKGNWKKYFGKITDVNGYVTKDNAIYIPAALIHKSLFNTANPNYYNYGTLGTGVGNLITHLIDNTNRHFTRDGKLQNDWHQIDRDMYKNLTDCLERKYNHLKYDEIDFYANGKKTLNTKISDIGGVKAAYYAYQEWSKDNSDPGMYGYEDFTKEQIFFLSYASMFCEKRPSNESLKHSMLIDENPPSQLRVLGTLKEVKEFSDAFECEKDTVMNPSDRCDMFYK